MKKKRPAIAFQAPRPAGLFDVPPTLNGPTLIAESVETQRQHVAKMSSQAREFGTDLLRLFNDVRDPVDFVREIGPNTYKPCIVPKMATHKLTATAWHKDTKKKEIVLRGFAIAVAAVPLRPRLVRTSLALRRCIPAGAPTYRLNGGIKGKRGVLRWLIEATKTKYPLRALPTLPEKECDQLYQRIRRASLIKKLGD